MNLTIKNAVKLEKLLKDNGFENIAEIIFNNYNKNINKIQTVIECEHDFINTTPDSALNSLGYIRPTDPVIQNLISRNIYCRKCHIKKSAVQKYTPEFLERYKKECSININFTATNPWDFLKDE